MRKIFFLKLFLKFNLFLILFLSAAVLLADDNKIPIDLEKAVPLSQAEGKSVPDENKSKGFFSFFNRRTPEAVKQVFLDLIHKIQTEPVETIRDSKEPAVTPSEFGPVFYLTGNDGFDIYFLDVSQYNNIMGLPFDNYYFVIFDKKTDKCSTRSFLVNNDFVDCYWDNLPNDTKAELVIDDEHRNGTGHYFEKTYYEIKNDFSVKKLFALYGSSDGDYFSEQKIIKKNKESVIVEDLSGNSETGVLTDKKTEEIKFEF